MKETSDSVARDRQECCEELLRLGFTSEELDHVSRKFGFDTRQIYVAVLEMLIQNVPESKVRAEFFNVFPELRAQEIDNER